MPERGYRVNCEELDKLVKFLHRKTRVSDLIEEEKARVFTGEVSDEVMDTRLSVLYNKLCRGRSKINITTEDLMVALEQLALENPDFRSSRSLKKRSKK